MKRIIAGIVLALLLSACGGNQTPVPTPSPTPQPIGWDTKAGAILMRLDRIVVGEEPLAAMNRLPLCTLYGDGYMTWISAAPPIGEEVYEARIPDATIRAFLDYLVREARFYSIPDYASRQLPPTGRYSVDSIVLALNGETRTLRAYSNWAQGEFDNLLTRCTHLSAEPVTYLPPGGWLSVQPVAGSPDPEIAWAQSAGFTLADVAASGKPMWVSGSVLAYLWTTTHRSLGGLQWNEQNRTYRIGLQVPGLSREAPVASNPTPTMPIFVPSATPTTRPTPTDAPYVPPTAITGTPS